MMPQWEPPTLTTDPAASDDLSVGLYQLDRRAQCGDQYAAAVLRHVALLREDARSREQTYRALLGRGNGVIGA